MGGFVSWVEAILSLMKSEKITFVNHDGLHLSAKIEFPIDQKPAAYAIFAHCFTCNKNLTAVRNISRALTAQGLAVLRFDFSGLGESEGSFVDTNFSTNITDILAAADYLKQNYESPTLLIGHSLGGAAALVAAGKIASVKGVATIGTPAEPDHVTHLIGEAIADIEKKGSAKVQIGGRTFTIAKHFLSDLKDHDLTKVIKSLDTALLIMHAPFDRVVGIENARLIYDAAKHPKSFISLDGADHILSDKRDSNYVGSMIATWSTRYLTTEKEEIDLPSTSQVVARLTTDSNFTTHIKAGLHRFTADEPTNVGGDNFGPSPYELVSAGLAACTAMTLQMYAKRKKWDLEEVIVHTDHHKIYIDDCDSCVTGDFQDSSKQKIDKIDRVISVHGDLSQEQKNRLKEIAGRCPVHRTLESKTVIETSLQPSNKVST